MFNSAHWARAFINLVDKTGGEIEDGIDMLILLSSCVKAIPGKAAGRSDSEKLELLIREALTKTNSLSPLHETAVRFLILMIKKNSVQHIDSVINKAKNILDEKHGVVKAYVEYAFQPDEEFNSILSGA